MKRYYTQYNVGKCKYLVNYHNGIKLENGSYFFDIATFNKKEKFEIFITSLKCKGFVSLNNEQKNITIYDNGGKTFDAITVVFNDCKNEKIGNRWVYDCLSCSINGNGFFQHSTAIKGSHLGKKTKFENLEKPLQNKLFQYFNN